LYLLKPKEKKLFFNILESCSFFSKGVVIMLVWARSTDSEDVCMLFARCCQKASMLLFVCLWESPTCHGVHSAPVEWTPFVSRSGAAHQKHFQTPLQRLFITPSVCYVPQTLSAVGFTFLRASPRSHSTDSEGIWDLVWIWFLSFSLCGCSLFNPLLVQCCVRCASLTSVMSVVTLFFLNCTLSLPSSLSVWGRRRSVNTCSTCLQACCVIDTRVLSQTGKRGQI